MEKKEAHDILVEMRSTGIAIKVEHEYKKQYGPYAHQTNGRIAQMYALVKEKEIVFYRTKPFGRAMIIRNTHEEFFKAMWYWKLLERVPMSDVKPK